MLKILYTSAFWKLVLYKKNKNKRSFNMQFKYLIGYHTSHSMIFNILQSHICKCVVEDRLSEYFVIWKDRVDDMNLTSYMIILVCCPSFHNITCSSLLHYSAIESSWRTHLSIVKCSLSHRIRNEYLDKIILFWRWPPLKKLYEIF
jgi:hypothetical protein